MKYLLSLAAFLVVSIAAFAQNPTFDWVKNVAWGPNYQNVHTIAFSQSGEMYLGGGYLTNLVAGTTGINFEGGITLPKKTLSFNTWFGKFDSLAKPIWIKGFNVKREGFQFAFDSQNNFYLSNKTGDTTEAFGQKLAKNMPFIYKFDDSGALLRADTFEFGASTDAITKILVDDSLNLYVAGYISFAMKIQGQTFPRIGSTDAFLAKFDSTGTLRWAKVFGGKDRQDGLADMVIDSKGFVYVTGSCYGSTNNKAMFDTIQIKTDGQDLYVAKVHPTNGAVLWVKTGGSSIADDATSSIVIDENDQLYITGSLGGGTSLGSQLIFGKDTAKAYLGAFGRTIGTGFVAKINSEGQGLWVKRFGSKAGPHSGTKLCYEKSNLYLYGSQSIINYLNDGTPQEQGMLNPFLAGSGYHFISKIDTASGSSLNGRPLSINQNQGMFDVAIHKTKMYVVGNLKLTYHIGADSVTSVNDEDAFVGQIGDLDYTHIPEPSNLTINSSMPTSFNVSWDDNASTETGQNLVYGPPFALGLSWPLTSSSILDANLTSFNITGLQANYLYEVIAFANYNNEVFSDTSNSAMDSTVTRVGFATFANEVKFNVFPNPSTNGKFIIEHSIVSNPANLEVYNALGERVYKGSNVEARSDINLDFLPNGTYLLNLTTSNGKESKTIIILRK